MLKFILPLLVLLIIPSMQQEEEQREGTLCQKAVAAMLLAPDRTPNNLMLFYSGRGINDLGNYNQCIKIENAKYLLLTFNKGIASIKLGLCLPNACSAEDMEGLEGPANMFISSITNMTGFKLHTDEPLNEYEEQEFSTGFYVTVTLISVMVVLSIFGVLVQHTSLFSKKRDRNGWLLVPRPIETDRHLVKSKTDIGLFFMAFSFKRNLHKFLYSKADDNDENLNVFNGIRVFCMAWVILGHTYLVQSFLAAKNVATAREMTKDFVFSLVPGGYYAVDTFFFISGFLASYLIVSRLTKFTPKFTILLYFKRYYRLVPPLAFLTLIAMFIMPYIGWGPQYVQFNEVFVEKCYDYWWSNFLFMGNFYPGANRGLCMGHLWFLPVDFQLFLLTPLLVAAFQKNKRLGYIINGLMILGNIIVSFVMTYTGDRNVTNVFDPEFSNVIYNKPWHRVAVYSIGIIMGFIYYEYKRTDQQTNTAKKFFETVKSSTPLTIILFIFGVTLTSFFVFIFHDLFNKNGQWSVLARALFNAFSRIGFVTGLTFVLLPMLAGRNRVLKSLLSADIFRVLSRITYSGYLIHFLIILLYYGVKQDSSYISHTNTILAFIPHVIVTMFLCVPFTLLFEVPFMNIERTLIFRQKGGIRGNKGSIDAEESWRNLEKETDWMDKTGLFDLDKSPTLANLSTNSYKIKINNK